MNINLGRHVVQSPQWAEFKTKNGKQAIQVGDIIFSKHPIPLTPYCVGYAPKVNFLKQKFNWEELRQTAKSENVAFVRFDVPYMLKGDLERSQVRKVKNDLNEHCARAPRDTFSKWNVFLDLTPDEGTLKANLKSKTRYNVRLAGRKGVEVRIENNKRGLKIFYDMHLITSKRQGFLTHSKEYFEQAFEILNGYEMANLLIAYHQGRPASAWMLFNYENTFYYPYGASDANLSNTMANNLIAWESIKLGKRLGCTLFDMWGAANDENHPFWGFTKFKLGYNAQIAEHFDSYDLVVNPTIYYPFNFTYNSFWKLHDIKFKLLG